MRSEKNTLCLACGYSWKSRIKPEENPYFDKTQCPRCYAYSAVSMKKYEAHLQHLRKLFTPEDAKKILEFFTFAMENNYMKTKKGSEAKYRQLLHDLANPKP